MKGSTHSLAKTPLFDSPEGRNAAGRSSASSKKSHGGQASDNFKVVLRIRPLNQNEKVSKEDVCLKPQSSTVLAITKTNPTFDSRARETQHTFTYDRMFTNDDDQSAVFSTAVEPVVLSTLQGYNGTVIAYGQTGSGKTYTIEGEDGDLRGIIPRSGDTIFRHIEDDSNANSSSKYLVRVSFFQIYNERITDLLVSNSMKGRPKEEPKTLGVREDSSGEVYVDGLSEHIVKSSKEIQDLLRLGKKSRKTAATVMNEASSRSHAVFAIIVERSVEDHKTKETTVTIGKLNMVDLAGSERVKSALPGNADRVDEAKNINSSLSAFGKVVMALTTSGGNHVPYRDSKLTRILQDSIGGNCKTTLITTVSPGSSSYGESLNSLKFAYRAKAVKNNAKVNLDQSDQALLTTYQREIKRLQAELRRKNKEVNANIMGKTQELDELQAANNRLATENEMTTKKLKERELESKRHRDEVQSLQQRVKQMETQLLSGPQANGHPESRNDSASPSQYGGSTVSGDSSMHAKMLQLIKSDGAQAKRLPVQVEQATLERKALAEARSALEQERRAIESEKAQLEAQRRASGIAATITTNYDTSRASSKSPLESAFLSRVSDPISESSNPGVDVASLQPKFGETEGDALDVQVDILVELADPETGIETRAADFDGHHYAAVFSGSDATMWFLSNVEGINDIEEADQLGQHLIDTGEIWRLDNELKFDGDTDVLYALYEENTNPPANDDGTDWEGELLPFHSACADGDLRALKEMLEYGTHPDTLDSGKHSAIMHAAINKRVKVIELLLKWGADTSVTDENGRSALTWAAYAGAQRCVKLLLSRDLSMLGVADRSGRTALHWCTRLPMTGCLNTLTQVAPPAIIDMQDHNGTSSLHWAVLYGRPRHVTRLIKCGANAFLCDNQGRTAAHYAVSDSRVDCLERLLKTHVGLAQTSDNDGRQLLHLAANAERSIECGVEILRYQAHVNLNGTDSQGSTPLHWAAVSNNPEYCSLLVQYGADLTLRDHQGKLAYDYAVSRGFDGCAKALRELERNPLANVAGMGDGADSGFDPDLSTQSFGPPARRGSNWANVRGAVKLKRVVEPGADGLAGSQTVGFGSKSCVIC